MLFKNVHHPGIRDGSITQTFRAWDAARVRVGNRYGFGASGRLEVDACERVKLGSIDDAGARRAGFEDATSLIAELRRTGRRTLSARSDVFRVVFHYLGEVVRTTTDDEEPSAERVEELVARLQRSDRTSRIGPWTRQLLERIAESPRVAASKLAPTLGRETRALKVDVRKLKALELTRSFEVGYELTRVGRAVLDRLRAID